jgi:TatD DNase family protein
MLETDSPWMKIDGKESLPTDVKIVAEKIAEIKNIPLEEVEKKTDKNAISLFKLELLY